MGNKGGFPGGGSQGPTKEEKKRQRERRKEDGKQPALSLLSPSLSTFASLSNIDNRKEERGSSGEDWQEEEEEGCL